MSDDSPTTEPELGPLCGDNGGRTGAGRPCSGTNLDDDGRCRLHPARFDGSGASPEELLAQAEARESDRVVPPPSAPYDVAVKLGSPLHPVTGLVWPPVADVPLPDRLALMNWGGLWMEWAITHWQEIDAKEVTKWLYDVLGKQQAKFIDGRGNLKDWNPGPTSINAVLHALENNVLYLPAKGSTGVQHGNCVNRFEDPEGRWVAGLNGLLNPRTMEVDKEFNPALFNTYSLPLEFDLDADPPKKWLECLDQWFASDEESIRLLRNWFCAVLIQEVRLQRSLLLIGPRRGGKGTISQVLTELVGRTNVAFTSWRKFGERFGLEDMIGKVLAVDEDMRVSGKEQNSEVLSTFLKLVSGENPPVERKGITNWNGALRLMVMLLSNDMPTVHDPSGAFAGRIVILRTRKSFQGIEDNFLMDKLREELPAILNWALGAIEDLLRDGLVEPAYCATDREQLRESTSEMAVFVSEACVLDPNGQVDKEDFRDAFNGWRMGRGGADKGLGESVISRQLRSAHGEIEFGKRGSAPNQVPVYKGIRLLPQFQRATIDGGGENPAPAAQEALAAFLREIDPEGLL